MKTLKTLAATLCLTAAAFSTTPAFAGQIWNSQNWNGQIWNGTSYNRDAGREVVHAEIVAITLPEGAANK